MNHTDYIFPSINSQIIDQRSKITPPPSLTLIIVSILNVQLGSDQVLCGRLRRLRHWKEVFYYYIIFKKENIRTALSQDGPSRCITWVNPESTDSILIFSNKKHHNTSLLPRFTRTRFTQSWLRTRFLAAFHVQTIPIFSLTGTGMYLMVVTLHLTLVRWTSIVWSSPCQ